MHDPHPIPSCFFSGDWHSDDPGSPAVSRSGQSVVVSVYRTKVAGHCRLITVTWCKNLLVNGLSVSVEGSGFDADEDPAAADHYGCKVELRPWFFWRKHGSKRFQVDSKTVDVLWDLRAAKFSGGPEPRAAYYVAVVSDGEVVLLLGDMRKEAFRISGSPPSAIDAFLVSKKEHVLGKRKFSTRAKFHDKGKFHDVSIECNRSSSSNTAAAGGDTEMVVKVDGHAAIQVKHLQWKFRGNETISVGQGRVEVYWDVHDWLFGASLKHALFIFKPVASPSTAPASPLSSSSAGGGGAGGGIGSSDFSLVLHAWKTE